MAKEPKTPGKLAAHRQPRSRWREFSDSRKLGGFGLVNAWACTSQLRGCRLRQPAPIRLTSNIFTVLTPGPRGATQETLSGDVGLLLCSCPLNL